MARMARIKIEGGSGFYHLCARTGGSLDSFPLDDEKCKFKLVSLLERFASVWCCSVAGFAIMGNHYHIVVYFDEYQKLPRKELRRRALLLNPGQEKIVDAWFEDKWSKFNKRLFDVSEFMRNLHSAFGRWYNKTYERHGRFWADRFKSTLLENTQALLDCMLYVELNV